MNVPSGVSARAPTGAKAGTAAAAAAAARNRLRCMAKARPSKARRQELFVAKRPLRLTPAPGALGTLPSSRPGSPMTSVPQTTIGIDFGTTNTVVSMTHGDGPATLVRFPTTGGEIFAFRSALSFHAVMGANGRPNELVTEAGPWAIEAYVEDPLETRFIQSFKTFAAS